MKEHAKRDEHTLKEIIRAVLSEAGPAPAVALSVPSTDTTASAAPPPTAPAAPATPAASRMTPIPTTPVTGDAPTVAAPSRGGSGASSSGSGAGKAKEAPVLSEFLAKMIEKRKISGVATTKVRAEKNFGQNGTAALRAYLTLTPTLTVVSGRTFTDARKSATSEMIKKALGELKENVEPAATKVADLDKWQGTKLGDAIFSGDPQGLVDFLKFAYVMCAEGNLDDLIKDVGLVKPGPAESPTDPTLKALRIVGALTPYNLLTITGPDNKITSGSSLEIEIEPSTDTMSAAELPKTVITIPITREFDRPVNLTVGKNTEGAVNVDNADALVQGGLSSDTTTKFKLTSGKNAYTQTLRTYGPGTSITFAAAPPPAAEQKSNLTFNSLAGAYQSTTTPGKTEPGEKVFKLRSIFNKSDGALDYTNVSAMLVKDVSGKRDGFTLRVQNPSPSKNLMLFIPVPIPESLQEAATHWVTRFITAPEDDEGGGGPIVPKIALMPVTEINFNFDSNWQSYGSNALPNVSTVAFVPYDTPFTVPGLNIKTAGELLAMLGMSQEKLDAAVRDYLVNPENTIGGPMLQTMSILDAMNSFPKKTYRL